MIGRVIGLVVIVCVPTHVHRFPLCSLWQSFQASAIIIAIFIVLFSRTFNIYPLTALINLSRAGDAKIDMRFQFVMWFSGLRGAIAFALALEANVGYAETGAGPMMLTTTLFVVLFTVRPLGGMSCAPRHGVMCPRHPPLPQHAYTTRTHTHTHTDARVRSRTQSHTLTGMRARTHTHHFSGPLDRWPLCDGPQRSQAEAAPQAGAARQPQSNANAISARSAVLNREGRPETRMARSDL